MLKALNENLFFKKSVNMFERMEIAESIYKDVVEPSNKNPTWVDSDCAGHSRNNRVESALSKTNL